MAMGLAAKLGSDLGGVACGARVPQFDTSMQAFSKRFSLQVRCLCFKTLIFSNPNHHFSFDLQFFFTLWSAEALKIFRQEIQVRENLLTYLRLNWPTRNNKKCKIMTLQFYLVKELLPRLWEPLNGLVCIVSVSKLSTGFELDLSEPIPQARTTTPTTQYT